MLAVATYNITFFILKLFLMVICSYTILDAQKYKTLREHANFFSFFRFALSMNDF